MGEPLVRTVFFNGTLTQPSCSYPQPTPCFPDYSMLKRPSPTSYVEVGGEIVLRALSSLGYEREKFGLHSLRSGGATLAANNGISDRLFKRHGRWKSETAKDGYIKDNLDALLSVSRSLQ